MEKTAPRTVSRLRGVAAVIALTFAGAGCAGRYAAPRTLAGFGAFGVVAGSVAWAAGEGIDRNGQGGTSHALVTAGFATVAAGIAAIVAAGGWMAISVKCDADPDCDEEEQCREIPAPPGGIPYKQCMPR
jgi:hypothetical protein